MKICIVSIELPSLKGGAPVRTYNILKGLVKQGHEIHLISVIESGQEGQANKLKQDLGINLYTVVRPRFSLIRQLLNVVMMRIPPYMAEFRASQLSSTLKDVVTKVKPDIVQFELLHAFDAAHSIHNWLSSSSSKLVLDAHNVEWIAFQGGLNAFPLYKKLVGFYFLPHIKRLENNYAKRMELVLTCSDQDANYFGSIIGRNMVLTVPNGVDTAYFSAINRATDPIILFMGGTHYPPNDDALHYYFGEIHQIIKSRVPKVRVILLGGNATQWLIEVANADANISLAGLVPDVRDYLSLAAVCISPVRYGSGTSLKVLEYMGSGKPVVSTTVGARGLIYTDGEDIVIADRPDEFATAVTELLGDKLRAVELGNRARVNAQKNYDWDNITHTLDHKYKFMLKGNTR